MLKKTRLKLMLLFTTVLLGIFLAGCSSQTAKEVDEEKPTAEQPKTEEGNSENAAPPVEETAAKEEPAVNKAQMMAANFIIAEQGVHTIAEELEKGNNDEGFLRSVQKAKATVESIDWTADVEEVKEVFYKDVIDLEKALIAQDFTAAAAPAKAAHESQHELDTTVSEVVKEMESVVTGAAKADTENNDAAAEGTRLEIFDWGFENLSLETGKQVITASNTGKMPHGVLIPDLGFMSEDIGGGETVSFEVDIKEPGTYKFYCSVPECGTPEQHGGMIGEIVVK